MVLRREVTKIDPASIGLQESDSMESVGLYDHLSPRLQSLLSDAKKVKERLSLVWHSRLGQAAKTYKNKILILQKHAFRLMIFGDYNSHAVPYFVSSSFL